MRNTLNVLGYGRLDMEDSRKVRRDMWIEETLIGSREKRLHAQAPVVTVCSMKAVCVLFFKV